MFGIENSNKITVTLLSIFTGPFTGGFRALFFEVLELHHFRHNKTFFEIGMDSTCRLWRFSPFLQKYS